jgi:hypothetical protein
MGYMRNAYKILGGKLRERSHFEELDLDGRIILKLTFQKYGEGLEWIIFAHYRVEWSVLENTAIKY